MLHIILYQPEIPPNTGNIIRLCANTGARLHLIEPLGFIWEDKRLRRAGLDYDEFARVQRHLSLDDALAAIGPANVYAFTTKGSRLYHTARFQPGDALLFGPETRGLPDTVLNQFDADHRLRLPMQPHSRSLNLSNTVAVALYEAWRQCGFVSGG
ncbi:tRNA (uridine(34)/cytosine(34)/5-carboxymethylaminomethyluridine(34)-2'-O)-methyltransferase TrmL [Hahella sp. SMD15-11]|uniref:tRNA (cytidine(34)-2'-O)-methyltransferase n=1 Tax=Thermohahella caldifontis TaxID=3142973 RepID=A0AB39UWF1_9GAMM